jgi:eukaryotic-like serine/threonine-protein kinase
MSKLVSVIAVLIILVGWFTFGQRAEPQLQLALVDLGGARHDLGSLPLSTFAPRISPDGHQFTFDTEDGNPAVWIADFPSLKSMRRLPGLGQFPMWSADGQRIFFIGIHNAHQALYWRRADGSGDPELLADPARAPEHLLTKTQSITFITLQSDYDVWRYSLADRKATPLVQAAGSSQHSSRVSPDERWLAYVSDETGRFEVYIQPLPQNGTKTQITKGGGEHPVWSPDGSQLYFNRADRLFSVSIKTEPAISAGNPSPFPIAGFIQQSGRRQFDITADGKQFLMLFPPGTQPAR